jgi:hypothetical protein
MTVSPCDGLRHMLRRHIMSKDKVGAQCRCELLVSRLVICYPARVYRQMNVVDELTAGWIK